MKKAVVFCLTVALALTLYLNSAFALTEYTGETKYTGSTNAAAIMLVDADSGTILYQKSIDTQIEPASTTKIMTLLVALEKGKMDDVVTVSAKAAGQKGSLLHISTGEKIVMKDLINGMMLVSGNDAAVAVAEHIGGSVDGFVAMMNEKAKELGMTNTNFVVPHGMHADNHYSTARDMALLTLAAMQNTEFMKIVGQKTYTMSADNKHKSTWKVTNTNKLLQTGAYYYQYATGIKTGSTPAAEDCLVSSATNEEGMKLVCLVFKAPYESTVRWAITKSLFKWGYENFSTVDLSTLLSSNLQPVSATVQNAAEDDTGVLDFSYPKSGGVYVTLDKSLLQELQNGTDTVTVEPVFDQEALQAPVYQNDVVGTIVYKSSNTGQIIYQCDLSASRDVAHTPPVAGAALPRRSILAWSKIWWAVLIPVVLAVFFIALQLKRKPKNKRPERGQSQAYYRYKNAKH